MYGILGAQLLVTLGTILFFNANRHMALRFFRSMSLLLLLLLLLISLPPSLLKVPTFFCQPRSHRDRVCRTNNSSCPCQHNAVVVIVVVVNTPSCRRQQQVLAALQCRPFPCLGACSWSSCFKCGQACRPPPPPTFCCSAFSRHLNPCSSAC